MPHTTYPPSWAGRHRRFSRHNLRRWYRDNEPLIVIYGMVALILALASIAGA